MKSVLFEDTCLQKSRFSFCSTAQNCANSADPSSLASPVWGEPPVELGWDHPCTVCLGEGKWPEERRGEGQGFVTAGLAPRSCWQRTLQEPGGCCNSHRVLAHWRVAWWLEDCECLASPLPHLRPLCLFSDMESVSWLHLPHRVVKLRYSHFKSKNSFKGNKRPLHSQCSLWR